MIVHDVPPCECQTASHDFPTIQSKNKIMPFFIRILKSGKTLSQKATILQPLAETSQFHLE